MAIPGNRDTRDGLLFSLPFLLVYAAFIIFPILFGLFISFFKWDILSTRNFIGFANYVTMFHDELFLSSLWHTLEFVLITTPTLLVAGFLMALLVTSRSPLTAAAENVFFVPYILSMTVVSTLWAWLLQKDYGLFNQVLRLLSVAKVGWLTDPHLSMWSVALATLWWTAGFNMILLSAGIKQIPREIYESAQIDGATGARSLINITIPLLRPTIVLCLILQVIASFNVFGQVYVMTGGGPYGTTRVLIQYVYETGFKYYKMGYSAAISYVLFFIILAVSIGQYASLRRRDV